MSGMFVLPQSLPHSFYNRRKNPPSPTTPTTDPSLRQTGGNYSIGGNSCRYIVVHYTGAPGSAKATATWSHRDAHGSSYHYVLDGSGTIWQTMRDTDTAWAVGAWAGCSQLIRNSESISIEVCSAGADFTPAEISELRWLVQRLMAAHPTPASRVVRHWDCHTGRKLCPAPYCGSAATDACDRNCCHRNFKI